MQLVAYGAQDIYLTGNPQITFFKVVYRRHTNFSMETIEQTIQGTSTASGSSGTVTISRNGDLVYKIYVTSDSLLITNGDEIVSDVELEIGGQKIDKHYVEWNQIWNELSTPESKAVGLKSMKGCIGSSGSTGPYLVQVPLNFWFCRNPGLALPLIALQYHEVKLKINWGAAAGITSDASAAACKVMCDYIYLDTDERRRFAQVSHEYLIEQLQKQSASASISNKLNFNHPVKELIWTSAATNAYGTAKLKLNGHDRFSDQQEEYFQLRQPFDYHTAVPAQNLPSDAVSFHKSVNTYSNITGNLGNAALLADVADGIAGGAAAPAATEFSPIKFGATGTTAPGSNTITAAGAAATKFIAVEGSATGSFLDGSLSVGDVHLVLVSDQAASAASKQTLAKIVAFHKNAAGTIPNDGTGPLASGQVATVHTDSGTDVTGNQLVIEYDQVVTTATALVDGDLLAILKVADGGCRTSKMTKKINVYSFALKPEEHQPSGTCNFSRIDNAQLQTNDVLETGDNIYAVNYNVLRIMSGMGGLAYSN